MMYPFLTLEDKTEIVHSELLEGGKIKLYIEKPDEKDCFHNAVCYLPDYKWSDINGFTDSEISKYREIIKSTAGLIIERAAEGGF